MSKLTSSRKKKEPIIMNRLAIILKEERITNRALAAELGYEEATVSKWATNTIQPSLATFMRIALTINRDLKDLLVSTKEIAGTERTKLLKELATIAENSKRVGKRKQH